LGWQRQTIHESEMALLFERTQKCCRKQLDTADIVREAIFRQLIHIARHSTVWLANG
jgi:hypothetical protein